MVDMNKKQIREELECYEVGLTIRELDKMIINNEIDKYWLEETKCSLIGMEMHLEVLLKNEN